MKYYPAFLNLEGKRTLLLGGGSVALRKLKSLIGAGAKVFVVSKDFSKPFQTFARKNKISMKHSNVIPVSLKPFSLVVARRRTGS